MVLDQGEGDEAGAGLSLASFRHPQRAAEADQHPRVPASGVCVTGELTLAIGGAAARLEAAYLARTPVAFGRVLLHVPAGADPYGVAASAVEVTEEVTQPSDYGRNVQATASLSFSPAVVFPETSASRL